jgi:hypothetical protein
VRRNGGGGVSRARICKRLRSPGIDSKESIPPACLAWRPGTSNRVVLPACQAGNRFQGYLQGLQILARCVKGASMMEYCVRRGWMATGGGGIQRKRERESERIHVEN